MERKIFEISWLSLWRVTIFAIALAIFYFARDIILGLILAVIISSGLDFFIDYLEKKGLPRVLGTIFVFVVIIIIISIILYTVVPLVVIDLNAALRNFSRYGLDKIFPLSALKSSNSFADFLNKISSAVFNSSDSPFLILSSLLGNVALFLSIAISTFYLCLTKNGVELFIRAVVPLNYEAQALQIYERSRQRISRWFRAQILLSLTIFVLVFVALSILGVKNALFLSLLAGLFEIVPYVGPILAGGAAVLSALTTSLPLAIYTLIAFILIQQSENHILVPLFMKKSIDVHPVIVISALLIGGKLGGILGFLVALPIVVVVQEILEESLVKPKRSAIKYE